MARRIALLTDNRFQIRCFPAGEIVPGFQVLDAVQAGTIECGQTSSLFYTGKEPSFAFFANLPFGLTARQMGAWLRHGGGNQAAAELYADYNVILSANAGEVVAPVEVAMCLHPEPIGEIPVETVRVARAAFPKGTVVMRLRDEFSDLYRDEDFGRFYPGRGQPAFAPWRLALVTVFQFLEHLSDRQAADAVRARIDWKYALGLELTDPGFHFSILTEIGRAHV